MSTIHKITQVHIKSEDDHSIQEEPTKYKKKQENQAFTYLKWTKSEDVLYVRFLKANVERMKKTKFRKPYNKFKKMSEYVTSKDSFQCRSHHQKMIKKFGTVENIIENLSISYQKLKSFQKEPLNLPVRTNICPTAIKTSESQMSSQKCEKINQKIKIENLQVEIKSQKIENQESFVLKKLKYDKLNTCSQFGKKQEKKDDKSRFFQNDLKFQNKQNVNIATNHSQRENLLYRESVVQRNEQLEKIQYGGEKSVTPNQQGDHDYYQKSLVYQNNLLLYWQSIVSMQQRMNSYNASLEYQNGLNWKNYGFGNYNQSQAVNLIEPINVKIQENQQI